MRAAASVVPGVGTPAAPARRDVCASVSADEGVRAVEAFTSVAVRSFVVTFYHETSGRREVELVDPDSLLARMPDFLSRNAGCRESFIVCVHDDRVIQVDDCDEAVWRRLMPWSFLTVRTSPGSYQAWLCAAEPEHGAEIRERLLRALADTSANGGAYGALRWPGSRNCKPNRRAADGGFPLVSTTSVARGRVVRMTQLEGAGLLAPRRGSLRARAKGLALGAAAHTGLVRLAAWQQRHHVVVLRYGGIMGEERRASPRARKLHVGATDFARHLDHLRRRYHVIALQTFVAARRDCSPLPPRSVVLTFDEGYGNFFTVAAPLLRERNLPATVFIAPSRTVCSTAPLPVRHTPLDDERYLTWEEIDVLRDQGIGVGIALLARPVMMRRADVRGTARELRAARAAFAGRVGDSAPVLALREWEYTRELADSAAALGYGGVLGYGDIGTNTVEDGVFALRRTYACQPPDTGLAAFAAHVSGFKRWWWRATGRRIEIR